MKAMAKAKAKAQTNGQLKRLTPEELAELRVLPKYKTPEEKRAAIKRATSTGPPDAVALDTGFLVEALIPTEPLHTLYDAFITRVC